jgi:hypothetical protein
MPVSFTLLQPLCLLLLLAIVVTVNVWKRRKGAH